MSDINLIISATDSASPVLKRINKQVEQFNRNAGKARRSGLTLGAAFKGLGIAAAAIGLGRIATSTVSTIAKFESLKATLKTVTGSADGARVAFAQIQEFTATTPFQLDEVTNAFSILRRNGIDTTEDSLKAFGNIAAANGKSFEQLAEAVADGLTGEFERLKEFGVKVTQENGKFITSMGGVEVAVSDSARGVIDNLRSMGEEGGRFATGLEDQANTLSGKFSNLQDNLTQFAANIGEGGLGSALKDLTDKFNGLFDGEAASNFAKIIGAGLGAAINVVVGRISAMVTLFRSAFSAVADAVSGLWPVFYNTFNNAVLSVNVFLRDILDSVGLSFADIVDFAKAGINGVINTFRAMYEQWFLIVSNIKTIWVNGFDALKYKMKEFYWRFAAFGENLRMVWLKVISFMIEKFAGFVRDTGETFNSIANFFGADDVFDLSGIDNWTRGFNERITESGELLDAYQDKIEANAEGVAEALDQIPRVILTRDRLREIYGIDNFEEIQRMLRGISAETGEALNNFGLSIDGDLDIQKLLGWTQFQEEFTRLREEGAAEEEALRRALENTTAAQDENTNSGNNNNRTRSGQLSYAQKLTKAYRELIATVTKTTEQDLINRDLLPQINQAYADGTINLGEYSEALQNINSQYEPMQVKAYRTAQSIKQGFAQMAGSITDVFFNMFAGVTSVFEGLQNIAKMVLQMVMKAIIQAYIVKPLLAFMGIPMFANGGIAKSGQPAIVGENGPELIVPNRDSRIVSNSKSKSLMSGMGTSAGGEQLVVNFNLTAVDTQTGVQFLLENKSTITGMIQSAYNQRGVRGPLG
jgi:hypothetical protein